jgi:hypothetical protein
MGRATGPEDKNNSGCPLSRQWRFNPGALLSIEFPGDVYDIALKAAETDATKRALATYGRPLTAQIWRSRLSSGT